jgi:deoxycytidine triphosphate deaminase
LRHHDRRLGAIVQVVRHEPETLGTITDEIFGTGLHDLHRRLALGETLAHLVYLERRSEVARVVGDDGTVRFTKPRRRRPPEPS